MNRKEFQEHLDSILESSLIQAARNPGEWILGCIMGSSLFLLILLMVILIVMAIFGVIGAGK